MDPKKYLTDLAAVNIWSTFQSSTMAICWKSLNSLSQGWRMYDSRSGSPGI